VVGSASLECDALSTPLLVLGADWLTEFGRRFPHFEAVVD
jgi:thiamine biosynthesis lipoprotein ApbE